MVFSFSPCAVSSVGRATPLHGEGREFKSLTAHKNDSSFVFYRYILNMQPSIIFEDDDVMVINKPAGLIVHSDGRTEERSVAEWVLKRHPEMKDVGEPWISPQGETIVRPGIVHRLDRTTSGVMILAKTQNAFDFLKGQFQKRTVEKQYLTYVYGHPKNDEGRIEAEIARTRSDPPRWSAEYGKKGTKRAAITDWKVEARLLDGEEKVALLLVSPKTGRTHQIRVHLKALGNAVVCDSLYAPGKPCLLGFTRPALHARSLTIDLPSGERKKFEASLPEDFASAGNISI